MGCVPSQPLAQAAENVVEHGERRVKRDLMVANVVSDMGTYAGDTFKSAADIQFTKGTQDMQSGLRDKVREVEQRYNRFKGISTGDEDKYPVPNSIDRIRRQFSDVGDNDTVCEGLEAQFQSRRKEVDGALGGFCGGLIKNAECNEGNFRSSVLDLFSSLQDKPQEIQNNLQQYNDEAEERVKSINQEKDKLMQQAWDKFCVKRDTAKERFYKTAASRVEAMKPGFDAWMASKGTKQGDEPLKARVNIGEWATVTPKDTIVYNNGKEEWRTAVDSYTQDYPDRTGARVEWSDFVKKEFAKLNEAYASMVSELLAKFNDPESGYSSTGIVPAAGALNVGHVTGQGSITHLTFDRVSADEERKAQGRFKNDDERLEYMRRYDRPVSYNGVHWTQTHIELPAMTMQVEGLYYSNTVGGVHIGYCFYDGKSSLEGMDVQQIKADAMKDL